MVGVILFLVLAGVAVRVVYGLSRPHFWLFSGVLALVVLPLVLLLAVFSSSFHGV